MDLSIIIGDEGVFTHTCNWRVFVFFVFFIAFVVVDVAQIVRMRGCGVMQRRVQSGGLGDVETRVRHKVPVWNSMETRVQLVAGELTTLIVSKRGVLLACNPFEMG